MHYGAPAKTATVYIVGFQTPKGHVLAIHRTAQETRICFQSPVPPKMAEIMLLDPLNNGNSNINGPLEPLRRTDTQRVEVDSLSALTRFLDWYDGVARDESVPTDTGPATVERLLFQLYRSDSQDGETFDALSEATGAKSPLMAYLFFLKDMDRFMPIQPTGFDRVFGQIGLDFRTLRYCSWQNYSEFNSILDALRAPIANATGLDDVRLVDAHSLLWLFSTLLQKEANGELDGGSKAHERVLGARERSIAEIKDSVGKTVFNTNGQMVEQKVKNKERRMTDGGWTRSVANCSISKRIDALSQASRCSFVGHTPTTTCWPHSIA